MILPAFSKIHQDYALNAAGYEGLFFKVVAGWISGFHLEDSPAPSPKRTPNSDQNPFASGVIMVKRDHHGAPARHS